MSVMRSWANCSLMDWANCKELDSLVQFGWIGLVVVAVMGLECRSMMDQSRADSRKLDASELAHLLAGWEDGSGPLYGRLAAAIEHLVIDGVLRAGHRLPPERAIATEFAVSRGTVVRAFDELVTDGVVERVQGSGTTVSGNTFTAQGIGEFVGERLWSDAGEMVDLLKAIPEPLEETLEAIERADLRALGAELNSAEPLGTWALRSRVAQWYDERGLTTDPHQIMITSGAQQALSLAIRTFVDPGDVVLGEDATWPGLIDVVRLSGGRYQSVRSTPDGVDVDELERHVERYRPALVALNPQYQNPTGTRMPAEKVAEVARIAREHRVFVIEDRVSASLGFDGRPRPRIGDYDTAGYDLTIDSLCKVAWPGLRLGWLRADAQIIRRVRSTKAVSDMFTSILSQAAALELLDRYDEIVTVRRAQLRSRADVVVDGLRTYVPDWEFVPPAGGLSVWAKLPNGLSASAFAQFAVRFGVQVASCAEFTTLESDYGHIRLPFTASETELAEGMRRIGQAWAAFDPSMSAATVI